MKQFFQIGKVYRVTGHKRNPGRLFTTVDSILSQYRKYIDEGTYFTILECYTRPSATGISSVGMQPNVREISVAKTFINNEILYLTYFSDSSVGQLINQNELFHLVC